MIDPPKERRALHALQMILCHARTMALFGEEHAQIAHVLDWAELLPQYLAAETDKTAEFENALGEIAEKHPQLLGALNLFSNSQPIRQRA